MNIRKLLSLINDIRIEILIIVEYIVIFIPFLFFSKPVRVGDGSEYYTLALAWSRTHKPFRTTKAG